MQIKQHVETGRQLGRLQVMSVVKAFVTTVGIWFTRARTRRTLAELDDAILRDIGLNRWEVQCEVHKPFWRP